MPHRRYVPAPPEPDGPGARAGAGLYPGEPETCRRRLRPFLLNLLHLGLLLAVFKEYKIEERAYQGHSFQTLVTLALIALPVHYLAPFRWKKPLFVAVSVGAMFYVFGTQVAAIVLAVAAVLIGTCRLPIRWAARAAICAAIAVALAWIRPATAHSAIPDNVWPVVASMFMFRMIIYLYELKHAGGRESLADTLSYFFLLPNYCFMHFPVVDYRTMQRGYFADDVHAMQRRGLRMMFRGTLHILCYRLVYNRGLSNPMAVHDPASLCAYLVCNYLLYLHVSGQFHTACGMLHLFGFQLPDTHHNYLLATGFTDYWRRINIYWKDFMVRVFFNPVAFRLKRWPQPAALAAATATVFLATWLLHAYQWYWLQGAWGFSVPDGLFWGILGGLVLVNLQFDARRGRTRARGECNGAPSARELAVRAAKVAGTFAVLTLLWSLWYSPTLAAWLELIRRGLYGT